MMVQQTHERRTSGRAALIGVVESTVAGMGYDLADCEVSMRGRLIRVFIDRLDGDAAAPVRITVDDCTRVTRQLQRVFEVEGIDYDRLEVSSPGLDRVLKTPAQFRRFAGQDVEIRLRVPESGRRRFTGKLLAADEAGIEVDLDGGPRRFALELLEKARLVPRY